MEDFEKSLLERLEENLKNTKDQLIRLGISESAAEHLIEGVRFILQSQAKQILSRVKDEYQKYHLQFDTETFMKVVEAKLSDDPK